VVAKRIVAAIERRRIEESYRDLFDYANDAILIHDGEGNLLDVNRAACDRLGYSKEELLKMGIKPFMPPEKRAAFDENISRIFGEGYTVLESVEITRSGQIIPVDVSARRIRYRGKDAVLSFSKDISERKRLEDEIRRRLEALYYHATSIWNISSIDDVVHCFEVIGRILGLTDGRHRVCRE
jgi:PAS domain S-box-containing protein